MAESGVEGAEELQKQIAKFHRDLGRELKATMRGMSMRLAGEIHASFAAAGLHTRSGDLLNTLVYQSGATPRKVWFGAETNKDVAFYAPWLEYGLAARPWHERAMLRSGKHKQHTWLNPNIGKGRGSGKAWGIQARPYMKPAIDGMAAEAGDIVSEVIERATEAFNNAR